jgi:hypothetical protein
MCVKFFFVVQKSLVLHAARCENDWTYRVRCLIGRAKVGEFCSFACTQYARMCAPAAVMLAFRAELINEFSKNELHECRANVA